MSRETTRPPVVQLTCCAVNPETYLVNTTLSKWAAAAYFSTMSIFRYLAVTPVIIMVFFTIVICSLWLVTALDIPLVAPHCQMDPSEV